MFSAKVVTSASSISDTSVEVDSSQSGPVLFVHNTLFCLTNDHSTSMQMGYSSGLLISQPSHDGALGEGRCRSMSVSADFSADISVVKHSTQNWWAITRLCDAQQDLSRVPRAVVDRDSWLQQAPPRQKPKIFSNLFG